MDPMGYPLTVDPLGSPGGSPKVLAHRPKCRLQPGEGYAKLAPETASLKVLESWLFGVVLGILG